ncbi:MAG: ZIP family metal transporter [Gammaproteobacteria bacterium]|nr:ZIP family metal transporter [Gammaproteobacteria bacterium]
MTTLYWIISFTFLGAVVGVLAASGVLMLSEKLISRLLPRLVSFAIGALLGAAFLGLLPHALEGRDLGGIHAITAVVLAGVLSFFLLEKMLLWRHCHAAHCEAHSHGLEDAQKAATATMVLVGDGIHNLVDGILIAAAFLVDIHLGIVTTFAVITHEIPQEVGDFAILLQSGYSKTRALLFNLLSSLTTIIGGVVAYFALSLSMQLLPYILAVAASSFLYIAMADLIPDLHKRTEARATAEQVLLIIVGAGVIYWVHSTLH